MFIDFLTVVGALLLIGLVALIIEWDEGAGCILPLFALILVIGIIVNSCS